MSEKIDINKMNRREFLGTAAALSATFAFPSALFGKTLDSKNKFHFAVTSDCHMHDSYYCQAFQYITCKAILNTPEGPGAFIIANGDMDPFIRVKNTIKKELIKPMKKKGKEYLFYPVVGNHDLYNTTAVKKFSTDNPPDTQSRAIIEYNKENLKNIVNWGPKFDSQLPGYEDNGSQYTNYSFDYNNCHFVVIDLYYANSIPGRGNGNFHKVTAQWLEDDLKKNRGKKTFVFAHEPATSYNYPNNSGTSQFKFHANPDNFVRILEENKVKACFSGHTHKYGSIKKNGVTYINTGKSGIPKNNTYSMIFVDGDKITYKSYVYQDKKWKEYSDSI